MTRYVSRHYTLLESALVVGTFAKNKNLLGKRTIPLKDKNPDTTIHNTIRRNDTRANILLNLSGYDRWKLFWEFWKQLMHKNIIWWTQEHKLKIVEPGGRKTSGANWMSIPILWSFLYCDIEAVVRLSDETVSYWGFFYLPPSYSCDEYILSAE